MTEKELITKIQSLKQIKPSQNWVVLAKSEIMAKPVAMAPVTSTSFTDMIVGALLQRRMVYSLATLMLVVTGVFGMMQVLPKPENKGMSFNQQSPEVVALRNNVAEFKLKSQNFADAALSSPEAKVLAVMQVKTAAKELTDAIKKDPSLARTVALDVNNNKTLLDVAGGNTVNEVSDMYETIVVSLMKDLDQATLNQDQAKELERIKKYLEVNHDYATALRDILLISKVNE